MNILVPETITYSSDVLQNTATNTKSLWASGTTYAKDAQVYKGDFVYQSAKASNTNHDPLTTSGGISINVDWINAGGVAIEDPWWFVVGMINPKSIFDSYITTATTATSPYVITVAKPECDSVSILNCYAASVTCQVYDGDDTLLTETTKDLYEFTDFPNDEWEWCFSPIPDPLKNFVLDLSVVTTTDDYIKLTFESPESITVGKIVYGFQKNIGKSQYGLQNDILDYSKITTDDFGERYRKEGRYAKNIKCTLQFAIDYLDQISQLLDSIRATDCVFNFNENTSFSSAIVYGLATERKQTVVACGDYQLSFNIDGSI